MKVAAGNHTFFVRSLQAAIGGLLLVSGVALARDSAPGLDQESAAVDQDASRGIEKSDIRRGQERDNDTDGDGLPDLNAGDSERAKFKAGKALADTVKNNEQPNDEADQQRRVVYKKLPHDEAEPLELMDETDPCPTLPCN